MPPGSVPSGTDRAGTIPEFQQIRPQEPQDRLGCKPSFGTDFLEPQGRFLPLLPVQGQPDPFRPGQFLVPFHFPGFLLFPDLNQSHPVSADLNTSSCRGQGDSRRRSHPAAWPSRAFPSSSPGPASPRTHSSILSGSISQRQNGTGAAVRPGRNREPGAPVPVPCPIRCFPD